MMELAGRELTERQTIRYRAVARVKSEKPDGEPTFAANGQYDVIALHLEPKANDVAIVHALWAKL